MNYTLHHGDNREVLRTMPSDSVDSIVCDPPYELGFMGKKWDSTGIAYDVTLWAECLRVLKPGGHLLAFGGSRTYHRLAVAIEDAGFEVRDCIMWLYGSGFPKSLAVDKAIDRQRHDREQVLKVTNWIADCVQSSGIRHAEILEAFGFNAGSGMVGHWTARNYGSQPAVPTLDQIPPLLALFGMTLDDVPDDVRTLIWTLNGRKGQPGEAWFQREVVDIETRWNEPSGIVNIGQGERTLIERKITAPATPLAQQWQGWGTALKPAHEPIVVARKPLQGTVSDNVTAWGVGALNIDGCRIETTDNLNGGIYSKNTEWIQKSEHIYGARRKMKHEYRQPLGRWPANIVLDEEAAQMLDEQSGGASRFFYIPKASKAEREAGLDAPDGQRANIHTTVKPIALMRYLVRMVTPRGGVVLDPFMGSGTTGCAAMLEGMGFVGIELSAEYLEIAERRIAHHASTNPMGL